MSKKVFLIPLFLICFLISALVSYSNDFEISKKDLKAIKVMEMRHFNTYYENQDTFFRIKMLEEELFDESFDNVETDERIKKLKIASQKKMLQGASLPHSIRISRKKIQNDRIKISDKDNVGIIDGLMKLYRPDIYKIWQRKQESINRYDDLPD